MKPEKKAADPSDIFKKAGIREDIIPILVTLGLANLDGIKNSKPSKLFNDVCGMRKKMRLNEVKNPTMEEVQSWAV